jgi:hypothetical protein
MEALLEREADVENWNDDRLDELSQRMDTGFKETKGEMKEGFAKVDREMKEGFAKVDGDMKEGFNRLERSMSEGFAQINDRFAQTDGRIDRLMLTLLIGALGLIGTLIGTTAL